MIKNDRPQEAKPATQKEREFFLDLLARYITPNHVIIMDDEARRGKYHHQVTSDNDSQGCRLNAPDIPAVGGIVQYDVFVECPHCGEQLALNQYPYSDDSTGYSLAEDSLGLALFGAERKPAQWTGLHIEYTCCKCHQKFRLATLEI